MSFLKFEDIKTTKKHSRLNSKRINVSSKDIAIIGIGLNLPQSKDSTEFWLNLRKGMDFVRSIPPNRKKDIINYYKKIGKDYQNIDFEEGAYLENIDYFDYNFFGISPKEASLMDPNQRLFLQVAWEAIESAGYADGRIKGTRTGVYVGYGNDADYKKMIEEVEPESLSISVPGNLTSIIGSRISYLLDLIGPSMLVNTACSSSLVSVHLACQALRNNECEMAIAGGVQTHLLPIRKIKLGIESLDNRTKTFDDSSDGTGGGEGVAAILLKPLSEALKSNDNIFAVIKGTSINQDGGSVGITAPSPSSQEDVISKAWQDADIDPSTIGYIEAHGTGTKLGDPIEVEGLSNAFKRYTNKNQFCAIGSVKSNIGHLDSAAGIAGLIKTILSTKYKEIPPSLHFTRPNREINFENTALYVNDELNYWESDDVRRAGVSSFGLSGTNCHVLIEEHKEEMNINPINKEKDLRVFTISAKNQEDIKAYIQKYIQFFENVEVNDLDSLCFTANVRRTHYSNRLAIIFSTMGELLSQLKDLENNGLLQEGTNVFYGEHNVKQKENNFNRINSTQATEKLSIEEMDRSITKEKRFEILGELCSDYVKGKEVDWNHLLFHANVKTVRLPTYPFKNSRCWLALEDKTDTINTQELTNKYYSTKWENKPLSSKKSEKQNVIVFRRSTSHDVIQSLKENGHNVYEIVVGDYFEKGSKGKYFIRNLEEDYRRLFLELSDININRIVHLLTISAEEINDLDDLNFSQEYGVYSLFYLYRALQTSSALDDVSISLVAKNVNEVTGKEEQICPINATMFGLSKSLLWEEPKLKIKCIDIEDKTPTNLIVKEMMSFNKDTVVAYRNNQRFIEELVNQEIQEKDCKEIEIKKTGAYVITGGLGRIGREMAKYLVSKNKANIILLGRTVINPQLTWEKILEEKLESEHLQSIAKEIVEIEKMGINIKYISVDITNPRELNYTLKNIRNEYGKINGLIHSAGIGVGMEGKRVKDDYKDIFKQVMNPKVQGTWLLDRLTREDNLDFFVTFSSVITLVGGIGSGSYIAANSYLDSFGQYRSKRGQRTLTINWPAWDKDGLVEKANIVMDKQLFNIISPSAAIAAFDETLNSTFSKVVIGELNYKSSIFRLSNYLPIKLSDSIKKRVQEVISNGGLNEQAVNNSYSVKLTGNNENCYTEVEKEIAEIWRSVLGFEKFDIYDNFFEIGGDSILLTKVFGKIDGKYPGQLEIADLFALSNIARIAKYLTEKNSPSTNESNNQTGANISDLVTNLENGSLSLNEALEIFQTKR
ncbi:hypothetical protein COM13_18955 [Bacillus pseudomycoides]|uniref:type I polyketide synthase n=1 Tax=Bacillus TaxID=1386 RepID=UPI0003697333|nr:MULTISPECIES: SDR family NAD(P)-dependent oxidoreductase [Bacillus]PDX99230.1 hypothetical protein COO07_17565 [Bacillus pseudomycoides]PEK80744.1 hypothetical protein CN597_10045 [Bacillus pseudomycoides]PEN08112.1 hypothetical protein CN640_13840 [Bacillus pseudomycoides]PGB87545.1 hypothetical protein COM13_18955 [Bacillus pseudomycoides]PGS04527.1 hypothetical protein COC54_12625 [Bacillus pseudomycoides]